MRLTLIILFTCSVNGHYGRYRNFQRSMTGHTSRWWSPFHMNRFTPSVKQPSYNRGNYRPAVKQALKKNGGNPANPSQWTEVVPSLLSVVPKETARLRWSWFDVGPGDTMMTGQMKDRPRLSWTTEPGALYTVVLSDEALEVLVGEGNDYIHWVVTNIPGNNIQDGNEMFQFIQPWVAQSDGDKHPYLALVFKQKGKVRMEEWQKGCSPSVLPPRRVLNKHATFVDKYGMELVAGSWFQVPFSGKESNKMNCYFSKCIRAPFPAPLPGVNDGPECQPSTEVFDITMRGPKVARLAEYGAGLSLLNPPSLINTIRNTKSIGISTGAVKDTQAYFGVFGNVRANGLGNLSSTLEGQVNTALFTYQSREGASRLFSSIGDPTAVQSTFAGEAPYHVIFSEPDDQNFDLSRLLRRPNEIVWITVANVTDANRAKHLELREKLFNIMLQSPYVKDFYKFNVWRGGDEFNGFDNSQMEVLIYTAGSREEQGKFTASLVTDYPEFINSFWDTFTCFACVASDTKLGPEFFPPFVTI